CHSCLFYLQTLLSVNIPPLHLIYFHHLHPLPSMKYLIYFYFLPLNKVKFHLFHFLFSSKIAISICTLLKRAVVEQNGQLIIIQAGEENPKFPIITDGQLQYDILEVIGKDEAWISEEIKKQGVDNYSDVFLGEYVDNSLIITTYK
ncbi:MAG: DUF421 domain-containing protein, partial [Peptostreptococcus sp.]|nr:DUF421 domain-containing protein [Peptostreptococcus sp.]